MCENLSPKQRIRLWNIISRKDRALFKLECCRHILDLTQKWKRAKTQTAAYRFKVELAVDCLLAEIISAKDSLLQEINDRLSLGLPPKAVNNNSIDKALKEVKKIDRTQRAEFLQDIWDMRHKNWLWRLNEYRNMAVHRSPLNFTPAFTFGEANGLRFQGILLRPVADDPDPREREVFKFLSNSLKQMSEMVEAIEKKLDLMT